MKGTLTISPDHGTLQWSLRNPMSRSKQKPIREIAISAFKAKCLSLLEDVSKTKTPLRVTRRGKAIADVVPVSMGEGGRTWIGSMADRVKIEGDIVSPVIDVEVIEALRN
jgi:prevent-host-death family protein